ncbi:hypothetical protein NLG97_g7388 [Lecanicillium saksenae]|uniref:Uncharacterized protein n=1 Tax=Lecanicillium saksenae TaxID=468837 RepID=A0ACC1QPI3_9HYPO|nr:hypothetical protein NLG97_g7388 [Lecanicillium saksenae]
MDQSTAAAYAALAIAIFAMFIAIAQVLQQYFVTGQLIRLCDSVVFGGLPGEGRRFWQMSQFRFRVVYKIPQIGLPPDLWPSSVAPSFEQVNTQSPTLSKSVPGESIGEASWAAFYKMAFASCYGSIGYTFVSGDADRCPADLPTIPMQMSLRDCVVVSLMSGMECTAASFDRGAVSMKGSAGTITSAQHPVLGPTVHFSPRSSSEKHTIAWNGTVTRAWLWRVMGNCVVAGQQYNLRARGRIWHGATSRSKKTPDALEELIRVGDAPAEPRKSRHSQDGPWQLVSAELAPAPSPDGNTALLDEISQPEFQPLVRSNDFVHQKLRAQAKTNSSRPTWTRMRMKFVDLDVLDKFGLEYEMDPEDDEAVVVKRWLEPTECRRLFKYTKWSRRRKQRNAEQEADDEPGMDEHNMGQTASEEDARSGQEHTSIHSKTSANSTGRHASLALAPLVRRRNRASGMGILKDTDEPLSGGDDDLPEMQVDGVHIASNEERESFRGSGSDNTSRSTSMDLGARRSWKSKSRDGADGRLINKKQKIRTESDLAFNVSGDTRWFWLAQADIIPGFWATPWRSFSYLHQQVCAPAVAALLEAIPEIWREDGLRYLNCPNLDHPAVSDTAAWMRAGNTTYPAYAHGTNVGTVCAGVFAAISGEDCGFAEPIPAVDLLESYGNQVDKLLPKSQAVCEMRLVELMRLDAWLSMVGRREEIWRGANKLLDNAPLLVDDLITEFEPRLLDIALVEKDEQAKAYADVGRQMVNNLRLSFFSKAEVLYLLVAALRTIKVGQAVLSGADTRMLLEIFEKDVQVYMI